MTNVTATASGDEDYNYGVYNDYSSSPTMTNVTATASGGTDNRGVYHDRGAVVIKNSDISGDTNSVKVIGGSVEIVRTRLVGDVSGAVTCKCVCDGSDTCYANTCP